MRIRPPQHMVFEIPVLGILSCAIVGFALFGCQKTKQESKIALSENIKIIKQEVLTIVPVGTKVSDAEKTMEQAGFKCQLMRNKTYVTDDRAISSATDFLWCDKKSGNWAIQQRVQVVIEIKTGVVKTVSVSTGFIGL